jgi:hypothetical protein
VNTLTATRTLQVDLFRVSPDGQYIAFLSADEPTADEERRKQDHDDALVWGESKGDCSFASRHTASNNRQAMPV